MPMESQKNRRLPVSDPRQSAESQQKGSAMTKPGAYAAVSYMVFAVLLVVFNKAALSSYNFPSANVITLFQLISSCAILYAMKYWKIISFMSLRAVLIFQYETQHSSFLGIVGQIIYAFLPLFISVGVTLAGALVAGARDLAFDGYAYSIVFIANICTAVYLASISRIGANPVAFGLMWCNGCDSSFCVMAFFTN